MNEILFLQVLMSVLDEYGVSCEFAVPPKLDPAFRNKLALDVNLRMQAVLDGIAEALRKDTSDFECIDDIIRLMESLGYRTVPRHDFI